MKHSSTVLEHIYQECQQHTCTKLPRINFTPSLHRLRQLALQSGTDCNNVNIIIIDQLQSGLAVYSVGDWFQQLDVARALLTELY